MGKNRQEDWGTAMFRGQEIRKNPQRSLRRKGQLGKDFNYRPWNLRKEEKS